MSHSSNHLASLTTSHGRELTHRVPCELRLDRCSADFIAPACVLEEGVAERLVIWCAGLRRDRAHASARDADGALA